MLNIDLYRKLYLARKLIHYDPTTSLKDGLKETWDRFLGNRDEYLNKANYFKE